MKFHHGIRCAGLAFCVEFLLVAGTAWGMGKKPTVQDALLDEQTVAAGLREALRVATERTVKLHRNSMVSLVTRLSE